MAIQPPRVCTLSAPSPSAMSTRTSPKKRSRFPGGPSPVPAGHRVSPLRQGSHAEPSARLRGQRNLTAGRRHGLASFFVPAMFPHVHHPPAADLPPTAVVVPDEDLGGVLAKAIRSGGSARTTRHGEVSLATVGQISGRARLPWRASRWFTVRGSECLKPTPTRPHRPRHSATASDGTFGCPVRGAAGLQPNLAPIWRGRSAATSRYGASSAGCGAGNVVRYRSELICCTVSIPQPVHARYG
jgi:hypothetical protein